MCTLWLSIQRPVRVNSPFLNLSFQQYKFEILKKKATNNTIRKWPIGGQYYFRTFTLELLNFIGTLGRVYDTHALLGIHLYPCICILQKVRRNFDKVGQHAQKVEPKFGCFFFFCVSHLLAFFAIVKNWNMRERERECVWVNEQE